MKNARRRAWPRPLGFEVIGFPPWGRAMPCQRGRLTAFFNKLLVLLGHKILGVLDIAAESASNELPWA